MAKWLKLETDMVDHPKTGRLSAMLNDPKAGWHVIRALSWLSRFCPTGHIRDIDGTSLEVAAEWSGEPGALLSALVKCGWLDVSKNGWEWHDWDEHQGKVASNASKERARKAAYRAKLSRDVPPDVPRDNDGTSAGRPDIRNVTGRDVTGETTTFVEQAPLVSVPATPKPPRVKPMAIKTDDLTDEEWNVFQHWRTECRHPQALLDPKRLSLIRRWLATPGVTVERLQKAITGCSRSAWHRGENQEKRRHDDLELILRDAAQLEKFEGMAA